MGETNTKKKLNGKQIATIVVVSVLIACVVVVFVFNFVYFSNPRKAPDDRISQGLVPTQSDLANAKVYSRVVILGVDGAGGKFSEYNTPNFDEIFDGGSINLNGMAQYPTMSAPNWASMLLGVTAQKHDITNAKSGIVKNSGKKYPSIFSIYAEKNPNATFYSCVDWANINKGIIEDNIPGMTKVNASKLVKPTKDEYNVDKKVAELAAERVKTHNDSIMFLHFDCVDHAGHASGNSSKAYKEAMEEVDRDLGIVYNAFKEANLLDETLFICVSDHGHTVKGGHGKESDSEKATTLAVAGRKGDVLTGTSGYYVTHDLASIVLYALGIEQPDYFEGGVPTNLFNTITQ